MNNTIVVNIIGQGGFPFSKDASTYKFKMLAKAIYEACILVRFYSPVTLDCQHKLYGEYDEIVYRKFSVFKPNDNKIVKLFKYLIGSFTLLMYLNKERDKKSKEILLISYMPIIEFIFYYIYARCLKYKIVISIMEYHPCLVKTIFSKINAYFFDHIATQLCDGLIPITMNLFNRIRIKSYKKEYKYIIIPALSDYKAQFNESKIQLPYKHYFVICLSVAYEENVQFCINSLLKMQNNEVGLIIVINGKQEKISQVKKKYSNSRVYFISNLDENELQTIYYNAKALLLPMRANNIQDNYRFPQKIAEYLRSRSPLLTNNGGIIKDYFKDNETAFIVDNYDPYAYSQKMDFIINNPALAKKIGIQGHLLGEKLFHYQNYSKQLYDFFHIL